MLFIKFGNKEHLEQLKNGIVHFSPIETFQNDPTAFRGDSMEGKLYLDPCKPLLINGTDISHLIETATLSYNMEFEDVTECVPLSFSASMLSRKNCHKLDDETYTVNDDFYEEMKQFGDSFFVFNAYEFLDALKAEFKKTNCSYEYHPVTYRDRTDYEGVRDYFAGLSEERKQMGYLFLKDCSNSYQLQAEWRMIVLNSHYTYSLDKNGATNIQTGFKSQMPVFEIGALKTLRCSEEYLFA